MSSHFIWYELLTTDANAAQRFYTDVVGWSVHSGTTPGMDYRHLMAPDGEGIGGMLQLTGQMKAGGGGPPWLRYIHVPDVAAARPAAEARRGETDRAGDTHEQRG